MPVVRQRAPTARETQWLEPVRRPHLGGIDERCESAPQPKSRGYRVASCQGEGLAACRNEQMLFLPVPMAS